MTQSPLDRAFFTRPVLDVAPDLLGRTLVHHPAPGAAPIAVRITEVEAYAGSRDPGSHAYRGRTPRNNSLFGPPGHLYVYFTYGMHHCANLVCEDDGTAGGVLLRAGEIIDGLPTARANRPTSRRDAELARGPARLALALGIDRTLDGTDACASNGTAPQLRVLPGDPPPRHLLRTGPRTGVGGAGAAAPWRFWIADDPSVSPYRAHAPRSRPAPTRKNG
jgi:DNA-3-methyladenine glycosylase